MTSWWTAAGIAALLCAASVAEARTLRVPGDYPGLTEAAEAARSGDKIVVESGAIGVNAVIAGKSRLTIIGVDAPILDSDRTDVALTIRDCDRISVRGLVLANAGTDGLRIVDSARVLVRDCVVRDANRMGILVGGSERVKLLKNTVEGARFHGIWSTLSVGAKSNTGLKVIRNKVTGCGEDGIYLAGGGHTLTKNDVAQCGQYGIHVVGSTASRLIRNEVADVGNGGIWVDGEKNRIDRNHVRRAVDDGVGVYGDRNLVRKNLVEDVEDDGIELEDGSRNKLIGNTIRRSGEHGIAVHRAQDNVIRKNDVHGSGAMWNGVDLRDYGGPDANAWKKNDHDTSDFST